MTARDAADKTFECPHCSAGVPSRVLFCIKCGEAVRCAQCSEALPQGAAYCGMCGTRVGSTTVLGSPSSNPRPSGVVNGETDNRNRLHMRATPRSLEVETRLSDKATESLGPMLASIVGLRIPGSVRDRGATPRAVDVPALPADLATSNPRGEQHSVNTNGSSRSDETSDAQLPEHLRLIFKVRGERLVLDKSELKASSQIDHVRRLTYLYLLAKEEVSDSSTPRDEVNTFWKELGLYDSNSRRFLANDSYIRHSDGLLELTGDGREQASTYAAEAVDPEVPSRWSPQRKSSRKPKGNRPAKSTKDDGDSQDTAPKGARSSRRGRPRLADVVRPWVAALDGAGIKKEAVHEAMKDESLADKGLVGLWAIYKVTGQMDAITVGQLARFLEDAFGVQVRKNNLERALKELRNQSPDLVLKGDGTRFKASPSTISHVEGCLQKKGDS